MSTPQEPNQSTGSQGPGSSIPPQTPQEPKSGGSDLKEKLNILMGDTKKLIESTAKTLAPYVNKGMTAAEQGFKKGVDLIQEQIKAHKEKSPSSSEQNTSASDTPIHTPSQTSSKMPEPPATPTSPQQTMASDTTAPTSQEAQSGSSETSNAPTSPSTRENEDKSPSDKS